MIGIHQIGHLLEGKEADSQWQYDFFKDEIRAKYGIDIFQKEVEIFVIENYHKIKKYAKNKKDFTLLLRQRGHSFCDKKVKKNTKTDHDKIPGIIKTVKPKRHPNYKQIGCLIFFYFV